jgi:hypothetical protein
MAWQNELDWVFRLRNIRNDADRRRLVFRCPKSLFGKCVLITCRRRRCQQRIKRTKAKNIVVEIEVKTLGGIKANSRIPGCQLQRAFEHGLENRQSGISSALWDFLLIILVMLMVMGVVCSSSKAHQLL